MKPIRAALILVATASLAACAGGDGFVSRALTNDTALLSTMGEPHEPVPMNPSYRVTDVEVVIPDALVVSEANSYKPRADIVWRGDPIGDRYAQVDKLMTDALTRGVSTLNGSRAVKVEITLSRFHALTEKTRYTFGGEHEVWMVMVVRDAKTGELLEPARRVGFNIHAAGGDEAIQEEAQGLTQKVVISNALIEMIRTELTRPRDFLQG